MVGKTLRVESEGQILLLFDVQVLCQAIGSGTGFANPHLMAGVSIFNLSLNMGLGGFLYGWQLRENLGSLQFDQRYRSLNTTGRR